MIKTDTAGKLPENFNVTEVDNIGVNTLFKDVIGNKSDTNLSGPGNDSLYGIAAYMAYYHVHAPSIIYPRDAAPVTITSGVGAWVEGTKVEIIPADTITDPFDIHFVNLGAISENDNYVLKLYSGAALAEVFWGEVSFSRDTNQMRAAYVPIQGGPVDANIRISASLLSSIGSNTVDIKLYTHSYP